MLIPKQMQSDTRMPSSDPVGTISAPAEGALRILRSEFEDESFSRDEGINTLVNSSPADYSIDVEESVAEILEDCSEEAAGRYLDVLLENGYLYAVNADLHVTPR